MGFFGITALEYECLQTVVSNSIGKCHLGTSGEWEPLNGSLMVSVKKLHSTIMGGSHSFGRQAIAQEYGIRIGFRGTALLHPGEEEPFVFPSDCVKITYLGAFVNGAAECDHVGVLRY